MTVRELLEVSLRDEAEGLPLGIRAVGYAVYFVMIAGLTYLGSMAFGAYGGLVGACIGVVLGFCISVALERGYRTRPHSER